MGIGALRHLTPDHGEVKSMHIAEAVRGRGLGSAMLRYLIAIAKARGYSHLRLETGATEYFQPARALYQRYGFTECAPYADYVPDPNSIFMSLNLRGPGESITTDTE